MMQQDEDPSTLCDVFEQMLQVNEDLLAAAAEQQQWSDSPQPGDECLQNATAYQLLLHKNLLEMANFVDSLCGVYVSVDHGSSSSTDPPCSKKPRTSDSDEAPHGTMEPSLLLSTLHANESLRARRRTEKKFLSFQKKVKEQEDYDKLPLPLLHPSLPGQQPPNLVTPSPSPAFAPPPMLQPPPHPSILKVSHTMLRPCQLPLPPTVPTPAPLLTVPSVPMHAFATNVSMDPLVQLPVKTPRLVVAKEECLACHRLGKSVKICRAVWKHTTPSWKSLMLPLPSMLAPTSMLMGDGLLLPHASMGWPTPYLPAFSMPTGKAPTSAARRTFKRMCEQCKLDHQSLYQCRTVLRHDDPEWKRTERPPGEPGTSQRSYSRWTDAEMQKFHELVEVHGYRDVTKLAYCLQSKDKKQVKSYLQRYLKAKHDGDG
ncbi:hypothetical protein H310_06971 [Aphanomyces invadans]|uniref:Myb-like domain-containing protein n=1 Tax=Aphanomyces invadans TaxID=157072 RepID=A0A024U6G2_9STRA|nr:hypothetical protein H310_06971 [Aphanomyces invadans]ETW01457.1 hypothetical protein H310_06971 [Aphanomyces invadans]|eukprot:XP_008870455.1 hypothetical protein H310_06971 [Aphanomyces invadans]